ncbi:MAG: hypothetical protein SNI72_05730, partial [Rikenellaceae bacterium]
MAKSETQSDLQKELQDEFDQLFEEFISSQSDEMESSEQTQFKEIEQILTTAQYEIDKKAIEQNMLHISIRGEQYVLYLFYGG